MKQYPSLLITLLMVTGLFAADSNVSDAINHYQRSEFSKAIPGHKQAVKEEKDTLINMSRLAQCQAAQALSGKDEAKLVQAIKLFTESDQVYQPGDNDGK